MRPEVPGGGDLDALHRTFADAVTDQRDVTHSEVKTHDVPGIGRITLDCEMLECPDDGQVLIVHSAAPDTAAAPRRRVRAP